MMNRLEGCAWRDRDGTHVQLAGLLPKYVGRAAIVDVFPLGNINYEDNPGYAEVFIDEWTTGGGPEHNELSPWQEFVLIATRDYERVKIYIEGDEVLDMRVGEASEEGATILRWKPVRQVEWLGDACGNN